MVFTTPTARYWWTRLLRPGFGHVYLLVQRNGWWWVINWGKDALRVEPSKVPAYAAYTPLVTVGDTVVRVRAELRERHRVPWVLGPLTCVEAVKAYLGVRAAWVWTPHQLYRLVRGGRV